MISIKLKIKNQPDLSDYFRQYGNLKRWAYNRFCDEEMEYMEIYHKSAKLNNLELLDASFREQAILLAQEIFKRSGKGIIFGGKDNFWKVKFKKESKEFLEKNNSFRVVGASGMTGNRKFNFDLSNNRVVFKPERSVKIPIEFSEPSKNQRRLLDKAQFLASQKMMPIQVTVTRTHIIFGIDESILNEHKTRKIKNRIMALDMNPNYIAVIIKDFRTEKDGQVIHKQVFDFSENNKDEVSKSKIHHEVFSVSKAIANLAKHYQVEVVGIEDLNIKNDKQPKKKTRKQKEKNKLIKQFWNRTKFSQNLKKWLNIYGVKFQEVLPFYSSFIGQLQNPEETDSVAAALEIARRTYLFHRIYVRKDMNKQDIIYPGYAEFLENQPTRWKEMVGSRIPKTWKGLFQRFQKSKTSYRFLFKDWVKTRDLYSFRHLSIKSGVSTVYG